MILLEPFIRPASYSRKTLASRPPAKMAKMQASGHVQVRTFPVILSLVVAVTTLMMISGGRSVEAQLVNNFYATHGCPNAENLITSVVTSAINSNKANAPGLLRMHFHDCFVRVCMPPEINTPRISSPGFEFPYQLKFFFCRVLYLRNIVVREN